MGEGFVSIGAFEVMVVGVAFFAALYLFTGALTWWLGHRLLPALGIGRVLDPRPLQPGQLARESGGSRRCRWRFSAWHVRPLGLAAWAGRDSMRSASLAGVAPSARCCRCGTMCTSD